MKILNSTHASQRYHFNYHTHARAIFSSRFYPLQCCPDEQKRVLQLFGWRWGKKLMLPEKASPILLLLLFMLLLLFLRLLNEYGPFFLVIWSGWITRTDSHTTARLHVTCTCEDRERESACARARIHRVKSRNNRRCRHSARERVALLKASYLVNIMCSELSCGTNLNEAACVRSSSGGVLV